VRAGAGSAGHFRVEGRLTDRVTPITPPPSPAPRSTAGSGGVPRLYTQIIEAMVSGVARGTVMTCIARRETTVRVRTRRTLVARVGIGSASPPGLAAEGRLARSPASPARRGSRSARAFALVLEPRAERGRDALGATISLVPRPETGASISVPAETAA